MTKTDAVRFEILEFGHWNLFEIWCLRFGILLFRFHMVSKLPEKMEESLTNVL